MSTFIKNISTWLHKVFFIEKLNNKFGLFVFIMLGLIISLGTAVMGIAFGPALIGFLVAVPLIYGIVFYPKFGILVLLVMSYMLWVVGSYVPIPAGVLMDGLLAFLLLGLLISLKFFGGKEMFKGPVTTMLLLWLCYNFLEVGNPVAGSRLAWVYTIRTVGTVGLTYYIFMYNIRSIKFIRIIMVLWMGLSLAVALYAFKQEFIGFTATEDAYLHSDPVIAGLLFIGGHWRKFSFLSDPVVFAYNMVMPSILCICLLTSKQLKSWIKFILILLIVIFFIAGLFSGTRGANILLPAALALFAVLKFNRKILVFAIFAAIGFLILIKIPTSNGNILRFQTAFSPNTDDSYNARKINQKRIQPYILAHPLGGGLGSTGAWGLKFTPGSYLASFPPDSGYMRVAVEEGWLGLIIFCSMMFVFIKTGINNFYLIKNPELKIYCLTMTLVVFTYNIANFPQEALVQYPSNVWFYLEVALINITYQLDLELTRKEEEEMTGAIVTGSSKILPQ